MAKANRTKRAGEREWGGMELGRRIGDKKEGRLMVHVPGVLNAWSQLVVTF